MALSMDEQRVLAEIERRLAAEEPGLATCLTNFRRPGPAAVLRSPRARIIGSLFTVLLVAMISLMVYAMIPFRAHGTRAPANRPGIVPTQTQISAAGTGSPGRTGTVSANAGPARGKAGGSAGAGQASVRQADTTTASGSMGTRAGTGAAVRSGGRGATSGSAKPSQETKAKTTGTSASGH